MNPIFQKEIDAFEIEFKALCYLLSNKEVDFQEIENKLKSLLLASLQRASLAVVEEKKKEITKVIEKNCRNYSNKVEIGTEILAVFTSDTLATAREITGGREYEVDPTTITSTND